MNEEIKLGEINRLRIDRFTPPGIFLVAGNGDDVLLPNRYVTSSMVRDEEIEVFIYTDSLDRIVATTQLPYVKKGEFGYLLVVDTNRDGAFVDWGLPKDLFVPRKHQKTAFEVGQKRLVYVLEDEHSGRLIGAEHVKRYLSNATQELANHQEVSLLIFARTPLGYKVIVNHRFEGMIYHQEIFETLHIGETKTGTIKNIRPDGKLDIVLGRIGEAKKGDNAQKILEVLLSHHNTLPFTYKSEAVAIVEMFGMSKKNFKMGLTELLEKKLIVLHEDSIEVKIG